MKQTIQVINQMVSDGIIKQYAIGGAIAAFAYVEASSTDDLDVLVSFEGFETEAKSGLVTMGPIVTYLAKLGYTEWRQEGLVIEGWPVQFLPVSNALTADCLALACETSLEFTLGDDAIITRILSAEHVIAAALDIGRPKDYNRIFQFIEANAFKSELLSDVLNKHGLMDKWRLFCDKFEVVDGLKGLNSSDGR
jgi:hypothetical protein